MYGLGGVPEPYFSENWLFRVTFWVFFARSGQVSDQLHSYPHYRVRYPPPLFWGREVGK